MLMCNIPNHVSALVRFLSGALFTNEAIQNFKLGASSSQCINGTTVKLFSLHRVKCADQTQPM